MNDSCLVLGGHGFLGYYVTKELLNSHKHIRCIVRRNISNEERLPDVEYVVGDAFNTDTLKACLNGIDSVYSFVSTSLPNNGEKDLENEIRLTLNSLDIILKTMVEMNVKNFVFPSSGGAIYGDRNREAVSEETKLEPKTAYGVGKQLCEDIIGFYCRKHGMNATVCRIGNVYGSERMRDKPQGVIDVFVQAALNNEPLKIWGDAGKSVRDYIHLEDAAKAIVSATAMKPKGMNVFNVGTGVGTSLEEIIIAIEETMGMQLKIERIPQKTSGVSQIVLDCSRLKQFSGWEYSISIKDGICRTIDSKKRLMTSEK